MTVLKAAVVQMRSGIDPQRNIADMTSLVRDAAGSGAAFVQTPEMTGLVQVERKAFFATIVAEEDDPVAKAASALAAELGIHLHVGSTPVRVGERMAANRSLLFAPDGRLAARYDKIHMFDVDLDNGESWRESAVYQPGKHAVMTEALGAAFGLGICYDCRFPALHGAYARAGAEILTSPSCFTRQTGKAHWHALLRARAIENGAFMIAAAQGGEHEDGRTTYGHSIIVNPWGEVLTEVTGEDPGHAVAEIDTAQVHAARAKIPNLNNGREFSLQTVTEERARVA